MTKNHTTALYFEGKSEAAKKRLQKLKAAKLINERPRRSFEPSILFLTREGLVLLQKRGVLNDYPSFDLPALDRRARVSDLTIRHEIEVMDVKAAFHATFKSAANFAIAEFSTWPLLNEFMAYRPGLDSTKVLVKPDGFIRIHETEADGKFERAFFLEVDRSSEVQERLVAKVGCYFEHYKSGSFAVRNGATRDDYKQFPFRVLIVFKTAERRNNTAERLLQANLPIASVKLVDSANTGYTLTTLNANSSVAIPILGSFYAPYVGAAQPQFQLVEYDFWAPYSWNPISQSWYSFLPGSPGFSPTNQSQLLVTPVGMEYVVAGYAKLEVVNSAYSGVYGYLGQYFTNAYVIDTNGVVTTNTTGVLSPYGDFFATKPGPVALVTMPDLDTGARGTCTVYCVSMNVDANHDGNMDLSFNGADVTSQSSPYVFWANNNYDRWNYDVLSSTNEQDDVASTSAAARSYSGVPTPDYDYKDIGGNRVIPCTRDLEDFARLWVCGITTNLLAILPAGSTVTLSWGDVGNPNSSNPTIDLFTASDADGGIEYLTNSTSAASQTDPLQTVYIGRLGPGQSLQLNASRSFQFGLPYNWQGSHYIWCGVSNGTGGLVLTIANANNNVLMQTTAYIQIQDIKQMYERWTVGDDASKAPLTTAIKSNQNLPVGDSAFQYTTPTDANTPYILLVHGYNMATWEKDRYAETALKRLYWQGYQGRFGAFNWPTAEHFYQFGSSELQAWNSAQGLLNKLNDLNAIYPGHVYLMAHSLGNVVASEALRLAGNNQVVNTYVAMQGAVAAHAYDPNSSPPV